VSDARVDWYETDMRAQEQRYRMDTALISVIQRHVYENGGRMHIEHPPQNVWGMASMRSLRTMTKFRTSSDCRTVDP
jgi:hypothetical protein